MQLKTFFFNLAESKYPLCHEFICFHPPICTFSACSSMRPCPGRGRAAPLTQICCLKFNGSSVAWGLLLFIKTQLERVAPTASLILSLCASWTLTLTSAALLDMDWVFFLLLWSDVSPATVDSHSPRPLTVCATEITICVCCENFSVNTCNSL